MPGGESGNGPLIHQLTEEQTNTPLLALASGQKSNCMKEPTFRCYQTHIYLGFLDQRATSAFVANQTSVH